jgi:NADH-quinone oxidoreductase subunit G
MANDTVQLEVNGVAVKARKGQMLIEVTDAADAYVPRFCYHPKLSVAANCRMCLVEVENVPKPVPACATPVADGMKVQTRSKRALAAQRATMEFLLINHPLDCPICDQGGECELQDLAMGFGRDVSRYTERKRVVKDKDLGPLVSTDMTRCIHCTRCVRFGQEIAGIQELGTIGRGESTEIGTFVERSVGHEMSGNIIDLCPVGALNNKPYRYRARSWEMTQHATVSGHDCAGSNLFVHVVRGRVMRAVPRPEESINETWLADRDRYSCHGLYEEERVLEPMVRRDGEWRTADWETALAAAADILRTAVRKSGPEALGFLAHPSSTLEEFALVAEVAAGLGSANLDHRVHRVDFRDSASEAPVPGIGMPIAHVEQLDSLLLVGSRLRQEVPILAHRVRKAALGGCKVSVLNPGSGEWLFPVHAEIVSGDHLVADLAAILKAVSVRQDITVAPGLAAAVDAAQPGPAHEAVAASLGADSAVWLGLDAEVHPERADLHAMGAELARLTGARFGRLTVGANSAGAALAGVQPHRGAGGVERDKSGLDVRAMQQEGLDALLMLNLEPEDFSEAPDAFLQAARVVALTPFASEALLDCADVILPTGTFLETSGTFVNCEGRWQSFSGAVGPPGEARPAWKVLRVLGNLLELDGLLYDDTGQVRAALECVLEDAPAGKPGAPDRILAVPASAGVASPVALYGVDALVRRSEPLQKASALAGGPGS